MPRQPNATNFTPQFNAEDTTGKLQVYNPIRQEYKDVTSDEELSEVAFSGDYDDLSNQPDLTVYAEQADLTAEITARTAADTTLQTNINTEATSRANADTTLQNNINTEAANRAIADANLQSQVSAINANLNASRQTTYGIDAKWTSATTYVDATLAGKTFDIWYYGNITSGGLESSAKQLLIKNVDYTISSGGGFVLTVAAVTNDQFLLLGPNVADFNQTLVTGAIGDFYITGITPGAYRTSVAATNFQVVEDPISTTTSHTLYYPAVTGNVFAIEGFVDTLTAGNIGVLFKSNGDYYATINASDLVAIAGGHKYTIPGSALIAFVGFNVRNVDAINVRIQKGDTIKVGTIKPELIDQTKIRTSKLINDANYLTATTAVTKTLLFNGTPADYLPNFRLIPGFYSNSGTGFPVTASTTVYHSELQYPVVAGDVFSFEGIVDSLTLGNIGKLFNSAGAPFSTDIDPDDLVAITGGYKYTVPVLSGLAFIGFTFRLSDVPYITVQRGSVIETGKIKNEYIDSAATTLPHLNNERFVDKDGTLICDSIGTQVNYATVPFQNIVKGWLNMNSMFNGSKSGTGLVKPSGGVAGAVNRISSLPATTHFWILWISINDYTTAFTNTLGVNFPNGLPLGSISNSDPSFKESNFCGALHFMINALIDRYPLASGFVMSATPRGNTNTLQLIDPTKPNNWGNSYYQQVIEAGKDICKMYSVPFLDLFNAATPLRPWIASNNTEFYFEGDLIHPNNLGHEVGIAPKVFSFMTANL